MFEGIWWVTYAALWVLLGLEGLLLVALARQVGVLHTRLGASGARMGNVGLELGDVAPQFKERDLNGQTISLGTEQHKPTLLIFTSTNCPICAELNPAIRALYHHEKKDVNVVIASLVEDETENRRYAERHHLNGIPYLFSKRIIESYRISITPYAILVDSSGRVAAKGMTNNIEHLESILNTLTEGYPSLDSKMNALTTIQTRPQRPQIPLRAEGTNGSVQSK